MCGVCVCVCGYLCVWGGGVPCVWHVCEFVHVCACVCVCVHLSVCAHVCACVCVCKYICTRVATTAHAKQR